MSELFHANSTARVLGVCRIGVFSLIAFNIMGSGIGGLADLPIDWFTPRGVFRCLPDVFFLWLHQPVCLQVLKFLALTLALLLVLGVRFYPIIAGVFCVLFLLIQGLGKGFSATMNHMEVGMIFCSWVLAMFPATDALAVHPPPEGKQRPQALYAAPMLFMSAVLCLFYSMLGFRRFIRGGLEIFTNDTIVGYLATRSLSYSVTNHHYGLLALTHPCFAVAMKAGFFVVTLLEVLSPLCLFHRQFRWLWLAVMIPFHISTLFTMNIFFKYNVVLIVLLLTPFCYLFEGRKSAHPGTRAA